jgi:hypothetical protein
MFWLLLPEHLPTDQRISSNIQRVVRRHHSMPAVKIMEILAQVCISQHIFPFAMPRIHQYTRRNARKFEFHPHHTLHHAHDNPNIHQGSLDV